MEMVMDVKKHRTALRRLPGPEGGERAPAVAKSRLDEEIVEDADSRHEQFVDERERWQADE